MGSGRAVGSVAAGVVFAGCAAGVPTDKGGNVVEPKPQVAMAPDGIEVRVGDTIRMRAWAMPPRDGAVWEWSVTPSDLATIDRFGRLVPGVSGEIQVRACANVPERICGRAPLTIR